jgi:hypothetical protein
MSVKYFPAETPGDTWGAGPPACSEAAVLANGGALAFDSWSFALHPDLACWRVTGDPIIIGSSAMSVMQGFEKFNFNIRRNATTSAVPTYLDLEGFVA